MVNLEVVGSTPLTDVHLHLVIIAYIQTCSQPSAFGVVTRRDKGRRILITVCHVMIVSEQ